MDHPRTIDLKRSNNRYRYGKKYYKCDPLRTKWTYPKSGLGWIGVIIFFILLILIIFGILGSIRDSKIIHPIAFAWLMFISVVLLEYFYRNKITNGVSYILAIFISINILVSFIFVIWFLLIKHVVKSRVIVIQDN